MCEVLRSNPVYERAAETQHYLPARSIKCEIEPLGALGAEPHDLLLCLPGKAPGKGIFDRRCEKNAVAQL
jgi:hypothetical protein